MRRKLAFAVVVMALALGSVAQTAAGAGVRYTPGAPGLGDPYYPLDGNGGYDVRHYLLDVKYEPARDRLTGVATIRARATQNLSRFNLDFVGLSVQSIKVDGRTARWSRDAGELTVRPKSGLRKGSTFEVVVRYRGTPETIDRHLRAVRLHPHRRRRPGRRRAARGGHLVPGQRPPERQGRVHVPDHRPSGSRGRGQRHPQEQAGQRRVADLGLGMRASR